MRALFRFGRLGKAADCSRMLIVTLMSPPAQSAKHKAQQLQYLDHNREARKICWVLLRWHESAKIVSC